MDATKQNQQANSIREEDDSQTLDHSPPAWASGSPESNAQDLAPPATYDPSSFSAPLNAMPTFKPRKSNRVSVLAYNPDGAPTASSSSSVPTSNAPEAGRESPSLPAPHPIGGGPPGLFGSSRSGGLATPSPPPGGPSGVRLPPPPMKNAGSAAAPVPYTKGDFRTAEIVNHWNDPPTQIFEKKTQTDGAAAHDFGPTKEILNRIIKKCSENVPAPQKRMFEDTTKRLQALQEQMDNGTVKDRIIAPLGDMIQGKLHLDCKNSMRAWSI
ncbi:hypothetical protein BGZ72_006747 [Mortierella alpina]|nr:hypothetical protein BGZ72_006747 [Mortierella alpina]